MHEKLALKVLVALCLLAACSGGDDGDVADEPGTTESADRSGDGGGESWTILQYSMADNNLEPDMMADLEEMAEVGTQDGLNLVALVDRSDEFSDLPLGTIDDWAGAKLLQVDQGDFTELADYGDTNSGDPVVLSSFIAQALIENPADHYALIVSDHGASWPGIGPDDSFEDSMELEEFQQALSEGLAQAGVERFDLLGFDACLMASYEVASALQPYADRMLASEETEPGHGWDYRVLQVLADDPSTDVDTLGRAIVDSYEQHAVDNETENAITLSLLDLTQMPALDSAMESFTAALIERGEEFAPLVGQKQAEVLSFGRNPDDTAGSHVSDLRMLVSEIGVEALDLSDETDAVEQAINDVVVYNLDSPGTLGAGGLTVYFPAAIDFFDPSYDETPGTEIWGAFLADYYGLGAAIPEEERPEFLEVEPGVFFDQDGLNILAAFDSLGAENLSEAFISYALVNGDGTLTYLGEEPGTIQDDGTALGIYDLTTLVITDGVDEALAFVGLTFDDESGLGTIDVPMAYFAPEDVGTDVFEDVVLSIVFDASTGDVVQETYFVVDEAGAFGELTADPEGIVIPKVRNVLPDGSEEWILTSDVGLFADLPNLLYELRPLETGTLLQMELTVVDFGGNSDTVTAQVAIP